MKKCVYTWMVVHVAPFSELFVIFALLSVSLIARSTQLNGCGRRAFVAMGKTICARFI